METDMYPNPPGRDNRGYELESDTDSLPNEASSPPPPIQYRGSSRNNHNPRPNGGMSMPIPQISISDPNTLDYHNPKHNTISMDQFAAAFNVGPSSISVESGRKGYGKLKVLRNVNMNVRESTIYGLLGSSGCGKTTLLSCIVGIRKLDRGRIFICGEQPGTPESGVPGKRVGYMPQEVALNGEFSISEVMHYFGRIYGMDKDKVEDRIEYLVNLLDLRKCKGQLKNFSGGQQRRVSFAVALLHQPEILILDEPTVGVDPLLRASIWSHLREIVEKHGTTVVITTHYIEEMRTADTVGIMRDGYLIAEDSPTNLMEMHGCSMLEEVVLKFCMKGSGAETHSSPMPIDDNKGQTNVGVGDGGGGGFLAPAFNDFKNIRHSVCYTQSPFAQLSNVPSIASNMNMGLASTNNTLKRKNTMSHHRKAMSEHEDDDPKKAAERFQNSTINILRALVLKNIVVLMRNVWFLLFLLVMPTLVVIVFCLAVGPAPVDLPLGIINFDSSTCSDDFVPQCKPTQLSCLFIKGLNSSLVKLKPMKNELEALDKVDERNLWGFVRFQRGFSQAIFDRTLGKPGNNQTLTLSQVQIRLDMTTYPIAQLLRKNVFDAFSQFNLGLFAACKIDASGRDIPLQFLDPIYGSNDAEYTEFVAPGIACGFIFFMATLSCGLAAITEKKDGMFNRCLVSGVTTLQIMASHLITQFGVIVIQTVCVFAVMFVFFDVPSVGNPIIAYLLLLLLTVDGMSLGLLLSTVFDEEKNAMLTAIAAVLPNYILAGLIWPFEGLPEAMRVIGYLLPPTLTGESIRSVLLRGWDLSYPTVWLGFVVTTVWIVGPWVLLYLIQRYQLKR